MSIGLSVTDLHELYSGEYDWSYNTVSELGDYLDELIIKYDYEYTSNSFEAYILNCVAKYDLPEDVTIHYNTSTHEYHIDKGDIEKYGLII